MIVPEDRILESRFKNQEQRVKNQDFELLRRPFVKSGLFRLDVITVRMEKEHP